MVIKTIELSQVKTTKSGVEIAPSGNHNNLCHSKLGFGWGIFIFLYLPTGYRRPRSSIKKWN